MDPLEVFKLEAPGEEYGAVKYRELILDILQDLGLVMSLGRLYVYIDIEKPVFAMKGLFRTHLPPLKVSDLGDVTKVDMGYQIKLNSEEHMADMMQVLWDIYGRERVEQPDRDVLVVKSDSTPAEVPITDVEKQFRQDLTDALIRIAPEGFRNRRNEMDEKGFLFIAAEETITPKLIEEVGEKIGGMENA